MNLRQKSEHPTLLNGPAFKQDTALAGMNDQNRKMTLRDASIYRLELAFIFNDTECMAAMLETLSGYPFEDQVICRFYIRACFMGLAAFSLVEKNRVIGNQCLKYFRRMKKLGSANAPPAYFFIAALKKPTKRWRESAMPCFSSHKMSWSLQMTKSHLHIGCTMTGGRMESQLQWHGSIRF